MTRVLVVDDARFMRAVISDILVRSRRFRVVGEAGDGAEALERFRELHPDLVIMDIEMPEMDGIEATKAILRSCPGATVVMCSALGQEAQVIESIAAGARDFIVKPFSSQRVLEVLDNVAGELPGA